MAKDRRNGGQRCSGTQELGRRVVAQQPGPDPCTVRPRRLKDASDHLIYGGMIRQFGMRGHRSQEDVLIPGIGALIEHILCEPAGDQRGQR